MERIESVFGVCGLASILYEYQASTSNVEWHIGSSKFPPAECNFNSSQLRQMALLSGHQPSFLLNQ